MSAPERWIGGNRLAAANIHFLGQALELLNALDDEGYRRDFPGTFGQGVGAHMRHIIEHYRCFFDGLDAACIDYDARARELALETERGAAQTVITELVGRLHALVEEDGQRPLIVLMACGENSPEERTPGPSSLARELQFLVSHSVHHFALIAAMLRFMGREPAPDFGVAPSTIRHRDG